MLWYKSWLDTRWRFLIALALLSVSACGVVIQYPTVRNLMPLAQQVEAHGVLGRIIKDAVDVQREYRGFVWYQWFRQNVLQMGTLFAVLLGSGGLVAQGAGGTLFTLSLPVSRSSLVWARASVGLAEWLVLALVPSLLIPMMSPAIGERYSLAATLAHGVCLFVAGAAFFSLAMFLSTLFDDLWRPLLIALAVAFFLAIVGEIAGSLGRNSIFGVMSGERYFRTGGLPWLGMLLSAAVSGALLYGAQVSIARRDF